MSDRNEMIQRVAEAIVAELERQDVYIHTFSDALELDYVIVDGTADLLKVAAAAIEAGEPK